MESNEYRILESLAKYHRMKHELELAELEKRLNDRINKLTERVNELLDELKPIEIKDIDKSIINNFHGNWKDNE